MVGSEWDYEGTVEICFNNIWGLISDSGWSQPAAEIVCRQLRYQTQGISSLLTITMHNYCIQELYHTIIHTLENLIKPFI